MVDFNVSHRLSFIAIAEMTAIIHTLNKKPLQTFITGVRKGLFS